MSITLRARPFIAAAVLAVLAALAANPAHAQARGGGRGAAGEPQTPQAQAPMDLTGTWVANISEDWRYRMVTPPKGDFASIPVSPAAVKVIDAWDPAKDEAAGEQCKAYGAPGLMRAPTRLRISWLDPNTLKVETDYGMQTRLLHFGAWTPAAGAAPTWQGNTVARWEGSRGRGAAEGPRAGSLRTVTNHLRAGYLRKNGVPYSDGTVLREHWDVTTSRTGDQWLVVTSIVEDPAYLQLPWITALHFKKEPDAGKWDPTPCNARW
jgi:hypothetical protein